MSADDLIKEFDMSVGVNPWTVLSPQRSIKNLHVIHDGGAWNDQDQTWSGWSVATMTWEGSPGAVGVRWNGEGQGPGNPQSRGLPTWFILPEALARDALDRVLAHTKGDGENASAGEAAPQPRQRLLDLIGFVRGASDQELDAMIGAMGLRPAVVT